MMLMVIISVAVSFGAKECASQKGFSTTHDDVFYFFSDLGNGESPMSDMGLALL